MTVISASEARRTLPAQLDRVEAGERVSITRHGRVVAVLVSPEVVRTARTAKLWEGADRIAEMLERARHEPLKRVAGPPGWADELVAEIRAGRDAR